MDIINDRVLRLAAAFQIVLNEREEFDRAHNLAHGTERLTTYPKNARGIDLPTGRFCAVDLVKTTNLEAWLVGPGDGSNRPGLSNENLELFVRKALSIAEENARRVGGRPVLEESVYKKVQRQLIDASFGNAGVIREMTKPAVTSKAPAPTNSIVADRREAARFRFIKRLVKKLSRTATAEA